jgi:hypothetical protein
VRKLFKAIALLAIPGAIFVAGIFVLRTFMAIRAAVVTGDARFDQFQSRISVAILWHGLPNVLTTDTAIHYARGIMALLHNENMATWDGVSPVVGDKDSPLGPSVGPLQVLRATAVDLGLVPADETPEQYAARANDVNWCLDAGVSVFFAKLRIADGDIARAIELYNGSGPRAETYRQNAMSWLMQTYGENPIG